MSTAGPRAAPPALLLVYGAVLVLGAVACAGTAAAGIDRPGTALGFALLVAVGQATRREDAEEREPAPLASAAALGYGLLATVAGAPARHGVLQVMAVAVTGALAGSLPLLALGRDPGPERLARRLLTLAFVALLCRPLYAVGAAHGYEVGRGPLFVGWIVLVVLLAVLCDTALATLLEHARTRWPYGGLLREELRARCGIGSAVCVAGAAAALAVGVAGVWVLPLIAVPLFLAQFSFGRYAAVRGVYRQTIAALARSTEIAGHTPPGHAARVAALSRAMGREFGLSERRLTVLEYAALMHDIGQLSLVDPVPGGATSGLPPAQQRRIAVLGAEVARQAGVPAEVAVVVERQADPCHRQPLGARIVRAANAYDELAAAEPRTAGEGDGPAGCPQALERLRRAAGAEYEPAVVECLARVVSRGGLSGPRTG